MKFTFLLLHNVGKHDLFHIFFAFTFNALKLNNCGTTRLVCHYILVHNCNSVTLLLGIVRVTLPMPWSLSRVILGKTGQRQCYNLKVHRLRQLLEFCCVGLTLASISAAPHKRDAIMNDWATHEACQNRTVICGSCVFDCLSRMKSSHVKVLLF